MNRTERRDMLKQYNPYTLAQLNTLTPSIDWNRYFNSIGVTHVDTVIVMQPEFFKQMEKVIKSNDLETWKAYLTYNIISNYSNFLNAEVVETSFKFYGTQLNGTAKMRDRWKRVLSTTNSMLGEAIGKLYVEAVFPPEAKATAKSMVNNIIDAMEARIENLDWMTPETKVKAQEN